ncbi:hypothetical protein BCR44DRAFT_47250 [Catenaria anguillulae PL171]|uniref:B30.2/SPRY domain-containing protein n=1 Tax=Catenaria anguillulae PL171 TaxID=765915 RepID=A0A1Y2HQK3_9FUNG|nr:hypothetical protein BCR44DRAFT_47250 [Catenaria anguillulae PL171]
MAAVPSKGAPAPQDPSSSRPPTATTTAAPPSSAQTVSTWATSPQRQATTITTITTTITLPTFTTISLRPSEIPSAGDPMATQSKGHVSVGTMTAILISLACAGALVVGVLLKRCARNLAEEAKDSMAPSSSGRAVSGQEDIPLASFDTSANTRNNSTPISRTMASPFSTQHAQAFLASHPPYGFPTDPRTLASMQISPAQWHLVNPTYTLSESMREYAPVLSPHMAFHPTQYTFKLFPTTSSDSGRPRPPAISVQTRLPVPLPPRSPHGSLTRSDSSPYVGLRVPRTLYCEFRILSAADTTTIAIGLARGPYPPFALPGTYARSVAYHSHLGLLHVGTESGVPNKVKYGPRFGEGDVVGVGVDTVARRVYFTVNGTMLKRAVAWPEDGEAVYPTVGATGSCEIEYNFGTSGFRWNGSGGASAEGEGESEFFGYVMDGLPAYSG